jgi:hypothetical protein
MVSVGIQKNRIPGESRDPRINDSIGGMVDPGFRRECDLNCCAVGFELLRHRSEHSEAGIPLRVFCETFASSAVRR